MLAILQHHVSALSHLLSPLVNRSLGNRTATTAVVMALRNWFWIRTGLHGVPFNGLSHGHLGIVIANDGLGASVPQRDVVR